MTDQLPPALREALISPALVSQHEDNATPTGSLQADRARAMLAALRWAFADREGAEGLRYAPDQVTDALAALEQESEGTG